MDQNDQNLKIHILEENNMVWIIVKSDMRERLNILNKERNIQEYNQNNHRQVGIYWELIYSALVV